MNDPYDEDDEYDDDQYNNDYPLSNNPYQWYYKFEIGPDTPISKWMDDLIKNIINNDYSLDKAPDIKSFKFPVNSWNPNTANNKFQYLGSNYQGSPIWKKQYFVVDKINTAYKLHLQSHAGHFVHQPIYYKGMFDILN